MLTLRGYRYAAERAAWIVWLLMRSASSMATSLTLSAMLKIWRAIPLTLLGLEVVRNGGILIGEDGQTRHWMPALRHWLGLYGVLGRGGQ